MATFADDVAVLSTSKDPAVASNILQNNLNDIENWLHRWRIHINETKSAHVTFTLKHVNSPPVTINNIIIPQAQSAKYLGIHLDKRLTWKTHIWNKRLQLNTKIMKLNWLLSNRSKLSLKNKVLLYKVILKPIWTYGIQLWGTASISNIEIFQRYQSKVLRKITNAPWFVSNHSLHKDLKIPTVKEEISVYSKTYQDKLMNHTNNLAINLLDNTLLTNRLKRCQVLDLPFHTDFRLCCIVQLDFDLFFV